jgi:hypothetical protein
MAPPAYVATSASEYARWKIRNTKYRAVFVTNGPPDIEKYRAHVEHMKDSFLEYSTVRAL